MAKIGFIGLGNMGGPMAANLIAAGHDVSVYDLVTSLGEALDGARVCSTPEAVLAGADFLISMLPAGQHVRSLYLGSDKGPGNGLLGKLKPDTLAIDCSTIDPESAIAVASAAQAQGIGMIDAPVSGGVAGAQQGTLSFIVGGDPQHFEKAKPILSDMGANIFHAGTSGAGQIAKICNNMLLAILMAGTAEAIAMGVNSGLDAGVLSQIMKESSGSNWALEKYNPYPGVMDGVPSSNNYQGGFLVDLMNKDLNLAMQTAESSQSNIPLGALAKNLFRTHQKLHKAGRLDFSSIQKLYSTELHPKS